MRFFGLICLVSLALFTSDAAGQLPESVAKNMGMETSWRSQIQMPVSGRGLVSAHLWVNAANSRSYAIVELPNKTIRIPADALDYLGKPLEIEGAKAKANEYAARLLGKPDGFQVETVTIPEVKLILVNSDGLVQALDAESGKLLWNASCGESFEPAFPGAVSPAGITVIQGPNLYLLDWQTGKRRMLTRLSSPSSTAVGVCNDLAFVGDVKGQIFSYGLETKSDPWSYLITGRTIGAPVSLDNQRFCAVASDAGYVYIFERGDDKPQVWVRYETSASITGSLASGNNSFFVGTTNGSLSKISVEDRLGEIGWEYRLGQTISAPALIVGESVYACAESGTILALENADGMERWRVDTQNLTHPIAECGGKVFAYSSSKQLVALDKATGRELARSQAMNLGSPIINAVTDRVYLVNAVGQVQCLHPQGRDLPTFFSVPTPEENAQEKSPAMQTQGGGNQSPFGAAEPAGGDANPFSDSGNPFDAGGDDGGMGDDNPFGGDNPFSGDNPFGG